MTARTLLTCCLFFAGPHTVPTAALTIYPITRAEVLAGARFHFKVEFPGAKSLVDLKVTIDDRDAAYCTR